MRNDVHELTRADVDICCAAAGYLDGTIHHFGTMRRESIARQLRGLALKIEARVGEQQPAKVQDES
jgi:hypothetical protein